VIDDRAYAFKGNFPTPDAIASFKSWCKKPISEVAGKYGNSSDLHEDLEIEIKKLKDEIFHLKNKM
jgi:hypothetical protein